MHRWLCGLLIALAGGFIALLLERIAFPHLTVAQIDLTHLVNAHVRRPDLMQLTEVERSKDAARYAARLEQETTAIAREYHVTILAAPAVIAGAPDMTAILRQRIGEQVP